MDKSIKNKENNKQSQSVRHVGDHSTHGKYIYTIVDVAKSERRSKHAIEQRIRNIPGFKEQYTKLFPIKPNSKMTHRLVTEEGKQVLHNYGLNSNHAGHYGNKELRKHADKKLLLDFVAQSSSIRSQGSALLSANSKLQSLSATHSAEQRELSDDKSLMTDLKADLKSNRSASNSASKSYASMEESYVTMFSKDIDAHQRDANNISKLIGKNSDSKSQPSNSTDNQDNSSHKSNSRKPRKKSFWSRFFGGKNK